MQGIQTREPASHRFRDLTGKTNEHGVTVNSHVGFAGRHSVWNCTCPRCGADFVVRGNCFLKQKSCGCIRRATKISARKKLMRRYHYGTVRKHCDPVWEDFDRFWQDIGSSLKGNERLYRLNENERLGPTNFIVAENRNLGHCGPNARLLFVCGQFWSVRRAAEMLKVSKQCISQRIARPGGIDKVCRDIANVFRYSVTGTEVTPQSAAAD